MGRGQETDLLFNPPKLHREKHVALSRERSGVFKKTVQDLVVINTPGKTSEIVARGYEGDLRFFDENFQEIGGHYNITDDAILVSSGSNVAWGDGEGFALKQKDNPENPLSFRTGPGGQVLALHLDDRYLYCLRHEEGTTSDTVLEKIALKDFDDPSASWESVKYDERPVQVIRQGDKTILWFHGVTATLAEEGHLLYLDDQGLGPSLNAAQTQALMNATKKPLITAGDEAGQYFLIALNDDNQEVLCHVQAKNKESAEPGYLGESESREIATLYQGEDADGRYTKAILWLGEQGVILTNREVILFDKEGIRDKLPLNKSGDATYDRFEKVGDRVLLWKRGSHAYLEISVL